MFWIFAALLSLLALAAIALPVLKRSAPATRRADYDRAVYKDQLAEIARDLERGLLTEVQAKAARLEVERRLLAIADDEKIGLRHTTPIALVAVSVIAIGGSFALYLDLGSPRLPDQPLAARVPPGAPPDLAESAENLEQRLRRNPDDAEGWLLLGRTQAVLERHREAANSFRRALELGGNRAEAAAGYGEMLVLSSAGTVTPAARDAFTTALEADPDNVPARYYLALSDAQSGRPAEAIEAWHRLEAEIPPESPSRAMVRQKIEETARAAGLEAPEAPRGPSGADIAAAQSMSPEERQTMIRGMVEGLAARLAESPNDAAGWQRLGRAYRVLGEKDKAVEALARAARLRPDDKDAILDYGRALLEQSGEPDPRRKLPDPFVAEMRKLAELDPRHPEALWYLGLAAAQDRRPREAADYWTRLLAVLPAGSEDATMVQKALDAVRAN